MGISETIKFGTVTLAGNNNNKITTISRNKVPGTVKQRFNEMIGFMIVPGKVKEMQIIIKGELIGTNKDSDRTTLANYDNGSIRRYDDGINGIDCFIEPGSLVFDDNDRLKNSYPYSMTLRQI